MSNDTLERRATEAKKDPEDEEAEKTVPELIAELKVLKEEDDAIGSMNYPRRIREIAEWAMSISNQKRLDLYPTWTDRHFQDVLDALGEDWLSGV